MEKERKLLFLCVTFIIVFNYHIYGVKTIQVAPSTNERKSEFNSFENPIDDSIDELISNKIQFKADLNHLVVDRKSGNVSWMPTIIDWLKISVNS